MRRQTGVQGGYRERQRDVDVRKRRKWKLQDYFERMTPEREKEIETTRTTLVRERGSGASYKRGTNNKTMESCCATFPTGSNSGS